MFTHNDRNVVYSAEEHRGAAGIVDMNVNNVRPESPLLNVAKCPKHVPQVDQVCKCSDAGRAIPNPIDRDAFL
jgi:hypothetical protein